MARAATNMDRLNEDQFMYLLVAKFKYCEVSRERQELAGAQDDPDGWITENQYCDWSVA